MIEKRAQTSESIYAFWRDRPVFLTGATGFVGSWLLEQLVAQGAQVVCLVRDFVPQASFFRFHLSERVKVVCGEIVDQLLLERILGEYEIDTVFHLAAQTIVGIANRNPLSTFKSNIEGTWALLEACRRSPVVRQIIIASSDKAYGDHQGRVYDEMTPLQGSHPYDVSKACADLIARSYVRTYGLPIAVTRCANFFGGGDLNWNRVIPGTIRSIIRAQPPVIRSDGTYIRDYLYVEDAAAAYMLLAEKMACQSELQGEAFNFSSGQPLTVRELVQHILRLMDSDLEPVVRNEASHEIREQLLNVEKARRQLDWSPLFTLEEGLRKTIAWYRAYFAQEK